MLQEISIRKCSHHPTLDVICYCLVCKDYKCATCIKTEPDDHDRSCISDIGDLTQKKVKKSTDDPKTHLESLPPFPSLQLTGNVLEPGKFLSPQYAIQTHLQQSSEFLKLLMLCSQPQFTGVYKEGPAGFDGFGHVFSAMLPQQQSDHFGRAYAQNPLASQRQASSFIPVKREDPCDRNLDFEIKNEAEVKKEVKIKNEFESPKSGFAPISSRIKTKSESDDVKSEYINQKYKITDQTGLRSRIRAPNPSQDFESESLLQNIESSVPNKYKVGQLSVQGDLSIHNQRKVILDTLQEYAPKLLLRNQKTGNARVYYKALKDFFAGSGNFLTKKPLPENWEQITGVLRKEFEIWKERLHQINRYVTEATEKIRKIIEMPLDCVDNVRREIIQTIQSIQLMDRQTLNLWASEFQNSIFRFEDSHQVQLICVSWTSDVVTEFNRKFGTSKPIDERIQLFEQNMNSDMKRKYENHLNQLIQCVDQMPVKTPYMWGMLVSITIGYQINSPKIWDYLCKFGEKLFAKSTVSKFSKSIIGIPQEMKILEQCYKRIEELSKQEGQSMRSDVKPQFASFFSFLLNKQKKISSITKMPAPETLKIVKKTYFHKKVTTNTAEEGLLSDTRLGKLSVC